MNLSPPTPNPQTPNPVPWEKKLCLALWNDGPFFDPRGFTRSFPTSWPRRKSRLKTSDRWLVSAADETSGFLETYQPPGR